MHYFTTRSSHYIGCALLLLALPLAAQCTPQWQQGPAAPGPGAAHGRAIHSLTVAANGDLIASGQFAVAGNVICNNIARFDGGVWSSFGTGTDGEILAVVEMPNGDLVVGGQFDTAGNTPCSNIARWDGTAWLPLGSGVDGAVRDLAILPNGDLVAVGAFTSAGSLAADYAAIWDGAGWSALGSGPSSPNVVSVTIMTNGDIVIGAAADIGVPDIERWDGSSWSPVAGATGDQVGALREVLALPNGGLAVLGQFNIVLENIAVLVGNQLTPILPPMSARDIALDSNGDLLAVGSDGTLNTTPVARYDGNGWSLVGNPVERPYTVIGVGASGVYVARNPVAIWDLGNSNILTLQSTSWTALPIEPYVQGNVLLPLPDGDVLFGGEFDEIDGAALGNVARHDGTGWSALGFGVDGEVTAMALAPDGSAIVGGAFSTAGGTPVSHIARWNGNTWSSLGAGVDFAPNAIAVNAFGSVLAVEDGDVMVFDGQTWNMVGTILGLAHSAASLANGDFLIAGTFVDLGQGVVGVARVSSGALTLEAAFAGMAPVVITEDGEGGVYALARSQGLSTLMHYDGSNLQTLGSGDLQPVLARMPDGDLLSVGVSAADGTVVRWSGSGWNPVPGAPSRLIYDVAASARGEIWAAGQFHRSGNVVSNGVARSVTPCPASAVTFGSGCVGSAGPVELGTSDLPWLGSVVRQQADGMAPTSIAIHVIGTQTGIAPLPLGAPGCSLIVAPIFSTPLPTANGIVDAPLTIPAAPSLIGQQVWTQIVGVELDVNIVVQQLTSSNAMRFTIGSF